MKTPHASLLTFAILAFTFFLSASNHAAAEPGFDADAREELVALEQFLRLSDEELDQLIAALQRVRGMTPEERTAFGSKIREFRALPGEQRRMMREEWRQRPRPENEDWRMYMHSLSPIERARLHEQLDAIPPRERQAFREEILKKLRRESPPES